MKFKRILIGVFIISFLIGCAFVPSYKKETEISFETATKTLKTLPPIETEFTNEILGENNDWQNDESSKFNVKLLEVGEGFHGDEIKAKSGETWLGLFKEKDNYFLRSTKLKIRRVQDPIVDGYDEEETTQKTGKNIAVSGENQPVYLLKNARELKEGKILTLFGGNPNRNEVEENLDYASLKIGFTEDYTIDGQKFSLKVKTGENKSGETIAALVLENEKTSQVLHSLKYFGGDDYLGTLYWVGDLDQDGKPDFYFDLYFHDNVEYKNLFISSKAEKNKLVKKIAVFITTGC